MTKEELITKKVSAISLGCDKNRVDLEKMLFLLNNYGFEITEDVRDADIVLVNTCAFIQPAKQEAIENIVEMEFLKKEGRIEKLIITGCLPERHYNELVEEFPLADAIVKLNDNKNIVNIIEELYGLPKTKCSEYYDRILTTSSSYAYLKIADGCSNVCSFCTIPRIRGAYKSQPMEAVLSEAKLLAKRGVKEIILVAQDTTRYGIDLYGEPKLIDLCKQIARIKGIEWIRIHYAYPEMISKQLLDYIVTEEKMCKYLDIPMQHIDNEILKSMRRKHDENFTRNLVKTIKNDYPQIKIRSTFIVGYPGESYKQFKKLLTFLKESKLDYVGFFPYYREQNTASYFMKKQKPQFIKNWRLKRAQKLQAQIAFSGVASQIGKQVSTLVDSFDINTGQMLAHTNFLSPSVDFGVKIVDNNLIEVGEFVDVKLVGFDGENFIGECK